MKSRLFFSEIYPGQEKNYQNKGFFDLSSFQYESLRQEIINYIYCCSRSMSIHEMEHKKIMIEFFGEFCRLHKPGINALADYPYTELLHDFKNWCTETQISKLNHRYQRKGYKDLVDCNIVMENFKDIVRFSFKHDMRVEIEKARWDIRKLELPYQNENISNNFIVNFSKITQLQIHCAMKRGVLLWIRYLSLSTVQQRVLAMTKFSLYLLEFYPDVQTIYQLDRDIVENYLIYRKIESKKQKNLTVELKGLKAAFEEFSKIYEDKQFTKENFIRDVHEIKDGVKQILLLQEKGNSIINTGKMIAVNRIESEQKIKLATMAIEQLIERGEYPSVTLLVKKTGLSRGFFYKNPEVRSRLDAAVQSPNVSCRRIWSGSKDSKNDNTEVLQMEIMEYKVRNRSLSQENEELRGQIEELKVQVEKLKGRIKKKELSMLKKL